MVEPPLPADGIDVNGERKPEMPNCSWLWLGTWR